MPMELYGIDEESTVRIQPDRRMPSEEFYRFCRANADWRIEQTADGEIVITPPAGSESGYRNASLSGQLWQWARKDGRGKSFDSSAGFELPNGATRSPDAAWASKTRLALLTTEQKRVFSPICPEFVVEMQSPTDSLPSLKRKMREWIDNGAQLGWLIEPDSESVWIYRAGEDRPEHRVGIDELAGEGPLAGFVADLTEIWEGI